MKRLLLVAGFVLAFATPAQAQTRIEIDCDSVDVIFQTSIQPDSATVEIQSNAGTETHNPTVAQGGSTASFPLDGQNGELVQVEVTLVYRGLPNVQSASETLAGCAEPSPSPSPSPITIASPTVPAPVAPSPVAPTVEPSDPIEEAAEGSVETRSDETTEALPEELAFTGFSQILGLGILAVALIGLGLYARSKGYRRAR